MDLSNVNWIGVIVCVIVSMIVGTFWFHPKTFFPIWWKAIGKTERDAPGMQSTPALWGLTVLASFVQAVFMSVMVKILGALMGGVTPGSGVITGILMWFGFVAPTGLVNKLFAGQLRAWVLETGNHLVDFVLFGAILGLLH